MLTSTSTATSTAAATATSTSPRELAVMTRGGILAAAIAGAVVAVLHLATAGRYDFFVNELYFIVCGRHPAFGYVDQPPLIPLLSALTQLGGTNVWLLRVPAVLAAVALVPLTVAFAAPPQRHCFAHARRRALRSRSNPNRRAPRRSTRSLGGTSRTFRAR
jgi:hypothetical protein